MRDLTIGQLAKEEQVNVEAVPYYEWRGLMPEGATGRRASEVSKGVITSSQGPIRETHSSWGIIFSAGNVLSVLLKQDISVLFTGTVRRRDKVLLGFQPIDDLFGGLLICLSAFRVKVGKYLVQTINTDLRIIRKLQHAPTNCWRFGIISSCYSTYLFKQ